MIIMLTMQLYSMQHGYESSATRTHVHSGIRGAKGVARSRVYTKRHGRERRGATGTEEGGYRTGFIQLPLIASSTEERCELPHVWSGVKLVYHAPGGHFYVLRLFLFHFLPFKTLDQFRNCTC